MNDLTLKGLTHVGSMKFHHIEGGFGEDKRSMLVKEIAEIHNKELKYLNKQINSNLKRFKKDIDIVDLRNTNFEVHLMNHEIYSQNAVNRSENIYLLSERGYSKLLKILEDDFAWEQYEKIVDGYFNMRKIIQEDKIPSSIKVKEIEAKHNNSLVRKARLLEKIANDPSTPKEYKQVLHSKAVEIVTGQELLPLPETEKMYTAGEIAKELGVSANKVGRIANKHKLKAPLYGKLFMDKSKHSPKQVQSWRYTEAGKEQLIKIYKEFYDV